MATYDNDSRVQPGISRDSRGASRTGYSAGRTAPTQRTPQRSASGTRTSAGQRPASGQRTASGQRRPTSQRPASGQRSSSQRASSGRRPAPRRKQPNRAPLFAALAAVVVLVLVLVIAKPFGGPKADPVSNPPVVPASNPVEPVAAQPDLGDVEAEPQVEYDNLEDKLADAQYDVGSLSAADMAQVTDLKVNTSLPGEWLNVLLLGTDERVLNDSARTDAMMICSINRSTGEVKLSSIMRDLAIEYTDIGKYNGTYRINAANYFGGPNLAMRTVNEKFNMNIQSYVMVNFYGFQRIAEKLVKAEVRHDINSAVKLGALCPGDRKAEQQPVGGEVLDDVSDVYHICAFIRIAVNSFIHRSGECLCVIAKLRLSLIIEIVVLHIDN